MSKADATRPPRSASHHHPQSPYSRSPQIRTTNQPKPLSRSPPATPVQQGHRDDQHDNDRSKLEEVFRNEFNLRIGTFSSTVRAENLTP